MTRNQTPSTSNKGFDEAVIKEYRDKMSAHHRNYLMIDSEDNSDEFKNFYFIGVYEGKAVIYDTALYTLRLHHNSELYQIAERKAVERFPEYEADEDLPDKLDEEIGVYMAEVIQELEDEGEVRVKEHVEIDPDVEFGVSLDVALNVEIVTPDVISEFVDAFNANTLRLDDTLYTFQLEDE